MNITHYYFDLGFCTNVKNNLQKEAKSYLETLNRSVIHSDDLEEAKKVIIESLEAINKKHFRCKPQNFKWDERPDQNTFYLSGFYECTFHLRGGVLKHMTCLPYKSISNN
jgi:hypothetical protein